MPWTVGDIIYSFREKEINTRAINRGTSAMQIEQSTEEKKKERKEISGKGKTRQMRIKR